MTLSGGSEESRRVLERPSIACRKQQGGNKEDPAGMQLRK